MVLARRGPLDEARVAEVMRACTTDDGIVHLLCADGACKNSLTAAALAASNTDDAAPRRCVELELALVCIGHQVLLQQGTRPSTPRGRQREQRPNRHAAGVGGYYLGGAVDEVLG